MKKQIVITTFITTLCTFAILNACKGPQGDPGPQGAAGTQGAAGATGTVGAAGPKGDPGVNGNANAVYSDWKTPVWDGPVTGIGSVAGNVYLSLASAANPLLTKEAINTAAIYTYVKYNALVPDPANAQVYMLFERISSSNSTTTFFKIPGRTTNRREDFSYATFSYDAYGENYFAPSLWIPTAPYDNTKAANVPIAELTNKTAVFYKDLAKTLPQFRQFIVYGNVKGGRLAAVNWNSYSDVQKALNLKD